MTVTEVRVTSDLSYATVFVTIDGSEDREAALEGLERARGFIRREMGQALHLRKIPEFRFETDTTLANASRIEELLKQARESDRAVHSDPGVDDVADD